MNKKVVIGTRGSDLARRQSLTVAQKIKELGFEVEIKIVETKGDRFQELCLDKIEGKGFFTKEIEEALLTRKIDLAVHSYKDLPTTPVPGLFIAAVSQRANPSDLLIIRQDAVNDTLRFSFKKNAKIGTSSARRYTQLKAFRPDAGIVDLRGNVPTRMQKLRNRQYDAILIAKAGIDRLNINLSDFFTVTLDPSEFIPAPAQGALAIQVRESDRELIEKIKTINDPAASLASAVERTVMGSFEGGCNLPLGAYCRIDENKNGNTIYKLAIAISESKEKFPKYFYAESGSTANLAEKLVEKIKNFNPVSLFITRNLSKDDFLTRCLEDNGCTVKGESLIRFRQLPLKKFPAVKWIFFSSRNAVRFFMNQKPVLPDGVKFGTIGKGTAEELRKYNRKTDFMGHSDDTRLTGRQFVSKIGHERALFPQAIGGMRTVQQQFKNTGQVIDLAVYETIKNVSPQCIGEQASFDIFVFTSPSNVESFLENYKIEANQKVIAMGAATENALKQKGIRVNKKPARFDDIGILQAVFSI